MSQGLCYVFTRVVFYGFARLSLLLFSWVQSETALVPAWQFLDFRRVGMLRPGSSSVRTGSPSLCSLLEGGLVWLLWSYRTERVRNLSSYSVLAHTVSTIMTWCFQLFAPIFASPDSARCEFIGSHVRRVNITTTWPTQRQISRSST
jgi:hypothetical protein